MTTTKTRTRTTRRPAINNGISPKAISRYSESEVSEMADIKVGALANRVLTKYVIATEKAIAHHSDPKAYPISTDPKSVERVVLARLRSRAPAKQQAAVASLLPKIKASAQVRASLYGDLSKINLKDAKPVLQQGKELPFPTALTIQKSYLLGLTQLHGQILSAPSALALRAIGDDDDPHGPNPPGPDPDDPPMPLPPPPPPPPQYTDKLDFRIHKVTCLDDTGEIGNDEIVLGGTIVDETGDTDPVAKFKVGSFDKGKSRLYAPPKPFAWFGLTEGGNEYPKSYFVTLAMAEEDDGGFQDFLNYVWDKVKKDVEQELLSAAIGIAIGGTILGGIIAAAAAYVVLKLIKWLISLFGDEIFDPVTLSIQIPAKNPRFDGKYETVRSFATFKKHGGHYQVQYDWHVYA